MDPVSVASGVAGLITLALQVSDNLYQYIKAVSERAKNAKELHSELLLLGEVLSQLRDFLNSEQAKGSMFDEHSVLQRSISECKARVERIGDKIKPKEGNKLSRAFDHLVWPFKQEQVLQMMENLRRFRSTFEFAVTIKGCQILSKASDNAQESLKLMLDQSKKIQEMMDEQGLATNTMVRQSAMLESVILALPLLEGTAEEVREISHSMRLSEQREQQRLMAEILDWLAPIETLHKHRDVQAKRSPGTGQWFLDKLEFRKWLEEDSLHDLLCIGSPGVGKSVLCSLVIDELRKKHKDDETAVIYYYCDYSEQQAQTPEHLARCILRQVCAARSSMPSAIVDFHKETRHLPKDETWFQELQKRLHRVMATFTTCYLVVDAFDETEAVTQRAGLFNVIHGIRSASTRIKVFATTRPHLTNIEDKFVQPTRIQVAASEADLRHYLGHMIDTHPDADDIMDAALKQEILDKLCENANGMFLLPSLHVRSILDQPTRADVKQALRSLSADLTAVFSSTLDRIYGLSGRRQRVAFDTLMWISHVRRPLKVDELQHALAVRFEESDINKDNSLSLRTILDSCCGLVEVDKDSNIIRLVHFSLEEFLQSRDHNLFRDADLTVTRTSLKYMSFDSVKPMHSMNRPSFERSLKKRPFLEYASMHWGHHAATLDVGQYQDLALPLLKDGNALLTIARVRDAHSPDFRKWAERMRAWAFSVNGGAAISLAVSFGLTNLVRFLLSQYQTPNLSARNMYGSTPLHEAAILGHDHTAEVLIAHGADRTDKNKGKATPFFLAVSYGRLSTVKTLLQYGRDQLDVACKGGFTSLHRAADLGLPSLVEFLLQEGALIAAHDDRGSTPLHHAALRGHVEVTKMLVLGGALVDVKANNGFTALDEAATAGHVEVAEFLLNNGANVGHRAEDYWTPLHRAARGAHVDLVVLLLERGADILQRDSKGNVPLHHAARAGSLETCVQLLEYQPSRTKAQLTTTNRKRETARTVAFFTAHYQVSKYLRSTEYSVLRTEPTTANKVTAAIEDGDLATVIRLLDQENVALNTPDEDGQPPLHVAVQEGNFKIAEYLLAQGAAVDAVGYHGWHALHIAASLGKLDTVNLCLAYNANIHARTSTQQTALHKAASSRSLPVLRRLVAAGAELEARNDRSMTCLHVAAHKNDEALVRALVLEYGVDVLSRDRHGQTAAMWAERGAGLSVGGWLKTEERRARAKLGSVSAAGDLNEEGQEVVMRLGSYREVRRGGDMGDEWGEEEDGITSPELPMRVRTHRATEPELA